MYHRCGDFDQKLLTVEQATTEQQWYPEAALLYPENKLQETHPYPSTANPEVGVGRVSEAKGNGQ